MKVLSDLHSTLYVGILTNDENALALKQRTMMAIYRYAMLLENKLPVKAEEKELIELANEWKEYFKVRDALIDMTYRNTLIEQLVHKGIIEKTQAAFFTDAQLERLLKLEKLSRR